MQGRTTRSQARGFTLVEVIVALAILGVLLVAAFQVASTSLEMTRRSDGQRISLLHARSLIDQLSSAEPLRQGEFKGDLSDGSRWVGRIVPYESQWNAQLASTPVQVYRISVTVISPEGEE